MSITVIGPGLLSSVQDRGRSGHAALGIGSAGAMDDIAARLANALLGNGVDAAVIEFTLIGPRLRFDTDGLIALTGGMFGPSVDGTAVAAWRPLRIHAGSTLDVGNARHGTRGYLAVHGGLDVERVLGSAASDINARLGPFGGRALRAGDTLRIGVSSRQASSGNAQPAPVASASITPWSLDPRPWFDPDPARPLRLIRGAHFGSLDAGSRKALFEADFRIHPDSNRVGFRLDGPSLALGEPLELVSEPVAMGTLQLPPGGQPIVLMAEHPTTGGYPRIGQVAAVDLPRLAQRRPGQSLRFVEIGMDEAQTRYLERERELARLEDAIACRLATND
jgi:antagonist of KipI